MKIDMHCHTKMSDGTATIQELIEMAGCRGLDAVSVTDHDTFAGSNRAVVLGKRFDIEVILGIEISAYDYSRDRKAHILCYEPRFQGRLEKLLKKITDSRRTAMHISVQKVARLYRIPVDMILARAHSSTNVYKQHIMHALIDAGHTNEIYGDVFSKLFHPKFGLARAKIEYPDVYDVLEAVKSAEGIAVLAHPSVYDSLDLMEELSEKGMLAGIELNHPGNDDAAMDQIRRCAKKHQLFTTGGTDFHGAYTKKTLPVGSFTMEEPDFVKLKQAIKKQKKLSAGNAT